MFVFYENEILYVLNLHQLTLTLRPTVSADLSCKKLQILKTNIEPLYNIQGKLVLVVPTRSAHFHPEQLEENRLAR